MNKNEKKLISHYDALTPAERETLLSFAEFLAGRSPKRTTIETPVEIERPSEESIVAAIKRLSASYPMIDKSKILSDVSEKVTQTVVFGRDVTEVIDELEVFFKQSYQLYVTEKQSLINEMQEEDGLLGPSDTMGIK